MSDFFTGFFYPLKSIKFFFSGRKIILYSIVPIIINALIYGTIFIYAYGKMAERSAFISGAGAENPGLFSILVNMVFLILGVIILLVVCYLLFITVGGLVTAPFNERISRLVEIKITGSPIEDNISFGKDVWLSFKAELFKMLFYLAVIIPLFLINFIPMIGSVISTVGGLIFSFFFNALDLMDYPLTRRYYPLRKKIKIVNSGGMLTYGFGCMAFIMMFVPVINVFLKPILVVSGTAFFFEKGFNKN